MTTNAHTFTVDETGFIQIAAIKVLAAVARGELDLKRVAVGLFLSTKKVTVIMLYSIPVQVRKTCHDH